ncbi:hypothetical protein C8R43DRAFT_962026 [Mycena crocata]|nr:hypothetical protein C8R43DRAFT_962026 [Mycena crocata]
MSAIEYSSENTVRHVTVCQLLRATRLHSSAPFRIDEIVLKHAVLVGNAYEVDIAPTYVAFSLDDSTGRIRVRIQTPYVRVVGQLQTYRGSNTVRATNILASPDPYEPYAHLLRAMKETIEFEKGSPPQYAEGKQQTGEEQPPGLDIDSSRSPFPSPSEPISGPSQGADVVMQSDDPLASSMLPTQDADARPYHGNPYLVPTRLGMVIMNALKDLTLQSQHGPDEVWDGVSINSLFDAIRQRKPELD